MFRISQYMQEIKSPTPLGPKRTPPGPVVIWNLIRRCNLTCKHCYALSADHDYAGELSSAESRTISEVRRATRLATQTSPSRPTSIWSWWSSSATATSSG